MPDKKRQTGKPNLIIDTREKTPWSFENDKDFESVVFEKLDVGDYAIKEIVDLCVIERKATVDELFNNFTKDKERIYAEIDRMKNYKYRFIVIEQDLSQILDHQNYYINKAFGARRNPRMPVAVVASNLTQIMLEHNVHVIFAGKNARSITKAILLRLYELRMKGKI
jgi:ERCC4-type nuclease